MKVGDLVVHKHAPIGEGRIRLVARFDKRRYEYIAKIGGYDRAIVVFIDGLWDWKGDWKKIEYWNNR